MQFYFYMLSIGNDIHGLERFDWTFTLNPNGYGIKCSDTLSAFRSFPFFPLSCYKWTIKSYISDMVPNQFLILNSETSAFKEASVGNASMMRSLFIGRLLRGNIKRKNELSVSKFIDFACSSMNIHTYSEGEQFILSFCLAVICFE